MSFMLDVFEAIKRQYISREPGIIMIEKKREGGGGVKGWSGKVGGVVLKGIIVVRLKMWFDLEHMNDSFEQCKQMWRRALIGLSSN